MTEHRTPLQILIAPLVQEAILPHKAHPRDAGFDLAAPADCKLPPQAQISINLGFAMQIPAGWYGQVFGRSSIFQQGLAVHPGVIDADFRGALQLLIYNQRSTEFEIYRGDRLAQLLILPVPNTLLTPVTPDQLNPTERGSGGMGSTGR